jgi:hypothetical protein
VLGLWPAPIVERVSDKPDRPEPPRVRVHLPGDVPTRLLRWRQDDQGRWWAVIDVPAAAVHPAPGEDYTAVPRDRAPGTGRYVIQTLPSGQLVLHRADCWAATGGRITPVPDGIEKAAAKFEDTEACEICQPLT